MIEIFGLVIKTKREHEKERSDFTASMTDLLCINDDIHRFKVKGTDENRLYCQALGDSLNRMQEHVYAIAARYPHLESLFHCYKD